MVKDEEISFFGNIQGHVGFNRVLLGNKQQIDALVGFRIRSFRPLWCRISGNFQTEPEFRLSAGDSAHQ